MIENCEMEGCENKASRIITMRVKFYFCKDCFSKVSGGYRGCEIIELPTCNCGWVCESKEELKNHIKTMHGKNGG